MFDASSQIYEFIFPGIFLVSINTQLISKIELNSLGDIENAKKSFYTYSPQMCSIIHLTANVAKQITFAQK